MLLEIARILRQVLELESKVITTWRSGLSQWAPLVDHNKLF